ncbi:hypothetical protein ACFQE5_22380 [Pseudonocardia hispaniensis]|uniref:Uncharacterized protein n=1 Tax=Pseudonocardia hispaniensis TaxID=904933 RepID=A0ABW1J8F8_9PSEU
MAIELTDEIRQAVHDEDCATQGHDLDVSGAMTGHGGPPTNGRWEVRGPDGQIAHLACRRCGRVWLLIEDAGRGYTDAVTRLKARVKDPAWVQPLPRPTIPTPPAS